MDDFDNKAAVMGDWFDCSPNDRKRPKVEHDGDFPLGYIKNEDSLQTSFQETQSCSGGGLRERIAERSGFNAPTLNTENIVQSTCLTISSPVFSPTNLLESESLVFISNPLTSPTVGKLPLLTSDKAKDELYDDINTSLANQSISGSTLDPTNIGLEPGDSQDYEQPHPGGLGDSMAARGAPEDDGYNWRKYGQKLVKGSEFPRSYYKCTQPDCEVKKKVERSLEGYIIEIIYEGYHNHPKPPPNRRSAIGLSDTVLDMQIDGTKQEGFAGTNENKEWRYQVSEKYGSHSESKQVQSGTQFGYRDPAADALYRDEDEDDRASHRSVSLSYDREVDESESKRRKLEAYQAEISGSTRANREPRVVVRVTSDIDIIEDGYRWRKYGQKVVKGNPNPRSYYKCTADGCNVTKHVERASDDFKSVLTTYIGKHTHVVPAARNGRHVGSGSSGTLQGSLATQTHNHNVHYPVPHSISEGMVTANSSLFHFQPHLRPPSSLVYIDESELPDLSVPGLTIGQDKLPSQPAPDFGDPAGLMLLGVEPKVEPESQQGLGLSASPLIQRDIISRLPHI